MKAPMIVGIVIGALIIFVAGAWVGAYFGLRNVPVLSKIPLPSPKPSPSPSPVVNPFEEAPVNPFEKVKVNPFE